MLLSAALLLALLPAAGIHGTVRAEKTGAPIPRATVQLPELSRAVTTEENGYFVLAGVPAGRWRVRASALGYRPHEALVLVPENGSVRLDFDLVPEPVALAPVEVRGRPGAANAPGGATAGPGATVMDNRTVRLTPALAEGDVLRAIQSLPSVAAASDFSSAPHVRGGLPDQNLITLDGVPLYNPYHLGGIFGAVDPDAVESVGVLAGAFPAGSGDRLSGIIDIRTREGGRDKVRGTGSVGLVSSRVGLDGPLPGKRGSFLFSGRRTYLDAATRGAHALGLIGGYLPYGFTDAHFKLTHDVGPLGRLSLSTYLNDEDLVYREKRESQEIDFDWGSRALGARLWRPWGATLAGEVRAVWSDFGGRFDAGEYRWINEQQRRSDVITPQLHAETGIRNALLGAGLTWYQPTHQLRAGVQADWYRFHHQIAPISQNGAEDFIPPFDQTDRPRTLAAYLEDEWTPGDALSLRAGLRVLAAGARGTEWMPRLGVRYALSPRLALWAGAGRSAQVMHSLRDAESVASAVVAYDILAAVPEEIGLTVADDVVLGGEWSAGGVSLRLEGYEKRFRKLPVTPIPEDPLQGWLVVPEKFRAGEGAARGLELLARWQRDGRGLSLAYTLAHTEREVDGVRFTPRFDRRHSLDLSGNATWGRRGEIGVRLAGMSGQPYTPVTGLVRRYRPDSRDGGLSEYGGWVPVFGEHNSARLPSYFRLDLSARRSYQPRWFGRATTVTPYLQVLNVLNSKNVLFAYPEDGLQGRMELHYAPQLPVFPTLGVEWRF